MSPAATQPKASPEIMIVAQATATEVAGEPKAKKAAAKTKATTYKATTAKASTPKVATAKISAAKAGTIKAGTSKPSTAKASTTKASTSKASTVKSEPAKKKPAKTVQPAAVASAELLPSSPIEDGGEKEKADAKAAKVLANIKVGPKGVYTEDSIRVYLQEIGRIRLLRADEEIELARKIADLLQLEELAAQFEADHSHHPDTKEWAALVDMPVIKFRRRLMLGRRAKEKMVQSNLRLVVSIAKKYMNRGLSFQDLIQEGSLGLIRAAEKFDHEKGYKFSTYATWWIRQAITRAIAYQSRTIRLPVHLYETISRIKKTTKTLSQEFGRKPTEEEIA